MKILVTAASKYGSTAEIARRIADVLSARGHDVDVEPADGASVAGHDAVVLGSAVYAGHWLPAAKDLVERVGPDLANRPVWLFSSGPVGEPPKPEEDPVDVAPIVAATRARGHRVFAGRIDRDQLSFPERQWWLPFVFGPAISASGTRSRPGPVRSRTRLSPRRDERRPPRRSGLS